MLRAHRLFQYIVLMSYILFWMLGFGTLWVGLKLFDDEVILIATLLVGSGLVLTGLFSLPAKLQFVVEVALIASLFHICIECIEHRAIAGSCAVRPTFKQPSNRTTMTSTLNHFNQVS